MILSDNQQALQRQQPVYDEEKIFSLQEKPHHHQQQQQQHQSRNIHSAPALQIDSSLFHYDPQVEAQQVLSTAQKAGLQPFDVICGKCSLAFNNVGNRRFRIVIGMNVQRYIDAPTRTAKSQVIASVVKLFKDEIGATFVKQQTTDGSFVPVSNKIIRQKVGHALRDVAAYTMGNNNNNNNNNTINTTTTTKSSSSSSNDSTKSKLPRSSSFREAKRRRISAGSISSSSDSSNSNTSHHSTQSAPIHKTTIKRYNDDDGNDADDALDTMDDLSIFRPSQVHSINHNNHNNPSFSSTAIVNSPPTLLQSKTCEGLLQEQQQQHELDDEDESWADDLSINSHMMNQPMTRQDIFPPTGLVERTLSSMGIAPLLLPSSTTLMDFPMPSSWSKGSGGEIEVETTDDSNNNINNDMNSHDLLYNPLYLVGRNNTEDNKNNNNSNRNNNSSSSSNSNHNNNNIPEGYGNRTFLDFSGFYKL